MGEGGDAPNTCPRRAKYPIDDDRGVYHLQPSSSSPAMSSSTPPPSLEHLALSATRLAAQLPRDLAFHRTIDDALRTDLDDLADRTHDLLAALLTLARPNAPIPLTTTNHSDSAPLTSPAAFKHVVDTVDWLLEGADDTLDVLTGKKRPPQITVSQQAAPAPTRVLPNPTPDNRDVPFAYDAFSHPYRRAITRLVVPHHVLQPLPAIHPKDTVPALGVDDAASVPPLPTDPPSFHTVPVQLIDTPEAFAALIGRLRRDVARAYPSAENVARAYPDERDVTRAYSNGTPTYSNGTTPTHELLLALDLEHHSHHSYRGFVCLLQLTTRLRPLGGGSPEQADYLIDALALRAHMHALNEFTTDARIVKILHGAASDIPWLAENFAGPSSGSDDAQNKPGVSVPASAGVSPAVNPGVSVPTGAGVSTPTGAGVSTPTSAGVSPVADAQNNPDVSTIGKQGAQNATPRIGISLVTLFDTYHAARALGLPSLSLAHLLKTYCGYEPDKRLARADWRVRPLPPTHLSYARSDTHFLPFIYDRLRAELCGGAPPTLPADPHGDGEVPAETPINVFVARDDGFVAGQDHEERPPYGSPEERAPETALTAVLQASARVCLRTPRWITSATLPLAALATARRAGREVLLDEACLDHAIYLALYRWRDATARAADEGVGTILPNSSLLLIADRWRNLIADTSSPLASNPTPTPLALAAPHAALASLVAPAALPAPVRLRAAEVVGAVLGAVRGWKGSAVKGDKVDGKAAEKAGKEYKAGRSVEAANDKDATVNATVVGKGNEEKVQEKEENTVMETKEAKETAKVTAKETAKLATPAPTASLFGRKPAVAASSSSLFGGALGARAASSSWLGGSASSTAPSAVSTTSAAGTATPAASHSALFGGTLRKSVTASPTPTPAVSAAPSLASIAARVHASFGVLPSTSTPTQGVEPYITNIQNFEPSAAAVAEHAFVPAGQRTTVSAPTFSSVRTGQKGLTDAERRALADAEKEKDEDAMDDGQDSSSGTEDAGGKNATAGERADKLGKKAKKAGKGDSKDQKSKATAKAAPSVADDAIVAGAGARQKKRKRTKGPAPDLSGDAPTAGTTSAIATASSTAMAAAPSTTQDTPFDYASASTPFDYASVPNILDAPAPPTTPTSERPRKKKRKVEEKGPHFRAPAPAPAEVRGVKVNLAHTFGK
ncbi:uncharacterized protein SCHCODRAFT_02614539 [Schizophyllum commune H4-8]|uniref:uncharacterized protein n=1 Tax=Schizophyllum commune (strain H4-8 / FGSC 9210) TaxID=578458 RepID=UPI00215E5CEE|nr:uncharacterized protein SCHCODRAFT_02614539 [Schizophyllum commune H4-8]KAI5896331.1 hypothetical protein SCHCODRAFT_02614539 [Schizophyllum commune H4-8]